MPHGRNLAIAARDDALGRRIELAGDLDLASMCDGLRFIAGPRVVQRVFELTNTVDRFAYLSREQAGPTLPPVTAPE